MGILLVSGKAAGEIYSDLKFINLDHYYWIAEYDVHEHGRNMKHH